MDNDFKGLNVQKRLMDWAEVTALSLMLLEASLRREFPSLSEKTLRLKVIERLNTYRNMRFSEG
jgi:hypothetical protein